MKIYPSSSEDLIAAKRNRERLEAEANSKLKPQAPVKLPDIMNEDSILDTTLKSCLNPLCDKKMRFNDKDCCCSYCRNHVKRELARLPELLQIERKWLRHRAKQNASQKVYHKKNPEKAKNAQKAWLDKNPNYQKEWRKKRK